MACGEIETAHPGYLGSQDTFYVGHLKGVGRIYQQTFADTYSKVAFAKLYTMKTAIAAADMLNDKVLPFFTSQSLPMLRVLTDRGSEYGGKVENHDYELYLAVEAQINLTDTVILDGDCQIRFDLLHFYLSRIAFNILVSAGIIDFIVFCLLAVLYFLIRIKSMRHLKIQAHPLINR